ncbi:MAG: ABC-2 family transporter protein [Planctomycetes bacterium]|nr:ABC-2 family transporter protein [Planctomycetota bacterium]
MIVKLLAASLRANLHYRASFFMQTVAAALITCVEFLGIWALFSRFGSLPGWSLPEVALFYGLINTAFALTDLFSRGFDMFADTLRVGDFDRVLLRPRAAALQIAGQDLRLRPLGRLAQGAVILAWAAAHVAWTPDRAALAALSLAGSFCLFYGLLVFQATIAFWTIDSLEMMNSLTYGGVYAGGYPLDIYPLWFRRTFTFAVPLACVNWYPVLAILGREVPPAAAWLAPLAGPAFLGIALMAWRVGVGRYASTGN